MTVLRNCRVVDVRQGGIKETSIIIEGNRIISFGNDKGPDGNSLDLEGGFILPGLINSHVHLGLDVHIANDFPEASPDEGPAVTVLRCFRRGADGLRSGVTTVRTVGTRHGADITLRSMIRQGWVEGPAIFSAGRGISVPGGHGSENGTFLAHGPEDFKNKAQEELAAGADHLKIFLTGGNSDRGETLDMLLMTQEEMEATVSVARSKNTYVTAHAGTSEPILNGVKAGVRSFEHGYRLDRKTARAIRESGGYLCPTLCVTRAVDWMKEHRFEPWMIEKALGVASDHSESVHIAIEEGIKLLTGTDIPPAETEGGINITLKEMEYLVDVGLSPLESIQTATLNPAELMRIGNEIGAVEPGYRADLIAVRQNPLKDIRAIRDTFFVMQSGKAIRWDQQ